MEYCAVRAYDVCRRIELCDRNSHALINGEQARLGLLNGQADCVHCKAWIREVVQRAAGSRISGILSFLVPTDCQTCLQLVCEL